MRTKNSLINIAISCLSYGIIMVGAFMTRRFLANILGFELLGVETTFLNAVAALAIVELGLGVGIVYKLYKPIADKNWDQVAMVLSFLRKCYIIIAAVVTTFGLISAYFVVMPIKENFSKLWLAQIFMLYVIDVVASYLYSHKRAMFIADQKNYVNNTIHIFAQIFLFISQIAVLKIFASFEAYLICKIFCRVAENIIISYRFNKKYNFINLKTKTSMPDIEKKDLFKNIKALLFHKIAGVGATAASSLIIAYFVNLKKSGFYGNYMLIVMALTTVTNEIFNGILASFGNLLNTESRKKVYDNFNVLYFLNFLLYSFIVSAFICLVTPFIGLLTGEGSAFNIWITISIAGYLYIYGMRQSIGMAKVGAGMYDPDKYLAIVGAVITLISSLILVKYLGIAGVMLGNIIGIMSISYWAQPYLVYDGIFKKHVKSYHYKFVLYTFLTSAYAYVTYEACTKIFKYGNIVSFIAGNLKSVIHIPESDADFIGQIIIGSFVCLIIPNVLNVIFFYRTSEFKNLLRAVKSFLRRSKV